MKSTAGLGSMVSLVRQSQGRSLIGVSVINHLLAARRPVAGYSSEIKETIENCVKSTNTTFFSFFCGVFVVVFCSWVYVFIGAWSER